MATRSDFIRENARRYIAALPPSIETAGGSTAIFNVAQELVRGFELPETDAFALLCEWNEVNSTPPWNHRELMRKLKDALRNGRMQMGCRIRKDLQPVSFHAALADKKAAEKRQQRDAWPTFHPLTTVSEKRIAALRGIEHHIVRLVNRLGYFAGADVYDHRCYIIREGNFAQARRLDGGMLQAGGREIKTKDLRGSDGAFIGWKTLGPQEAPILLVEGAIGILEGFAAIAEMELDAAGWSVLAATSAGSRFTALDLHRLKGRKFRIVPDADKAGLEAAGNWSAALEAVGCEVKVYQLPEGAKDIGAVLSDKQTLTEIFSAYA